MTFRMDPRAKLYLLLLANLLLLFHVGTAAEAATTALCLLLFFLSSKIGMGLRLSALYFGLLAVDIFVVPRAGEGVLLNLLSLVSVGVRMMLPCIITGAYAFSTTTIGELTAALRRMHVPESVIIPCAVVVRFFPTVGEDYRQIRAAMALRGIARGARRPAAAPDAVAGIRPDAAFDEQQQRGAGSVCRCADQGYRPAGAAHLHD